MKRGSRKPEKASTRPPARPKSSFPRTDTRAPKRGKAAGAPTKPAQTAKPANKAPIGGTSIGGKPTGPASVERIASTETPRGKNAPTPPVAEPEVKPRKLNAREVAERKDRFNDTYGRKRELEKEKKRVTADLSREITKLGKECDQLHDEIKQGREMLRQGELPLEPPDAELEAGASTPSMPAKSADIALGAIAKHVVDSITGKNGDANDEQEPPPKVDPAKADVVRMAAKTSGAADDIAAAVQREQGGEARP